MMWRRSWVGMLLLVVLAAPIARAGSILAVHHRFGHSHGGYPPMGGGHAGYGRGGQGGGLPYYGVPIGVVSPWYGYGYGPYPGFAYGPGYGYAPQFNAINPAAIAMPVAPMGPTRSTPATTSRTKRTDPAYASELMTLGDRLFRAGNFAKAVERYEQSIKADPAKAAPRVRLAQVAMVRGQYREAANWLREADTVEPTYLLTAADIRALYLEPGDFTKPLAKLEAHLQSHPEDRDSWLLLGAEHYFSGQTRQAADIFLRLTDRRAEPALSAFLSASKARDDR